MRRLNITAVCYLNTIPFVFGLHRTSNKLCANLLLAIPAQCTQNFIDKKADIALIPTADIRLFNPEDITIITNYCIGASGAVRSVALLSDYPIDQIETIYLDSHSHTSVELTKILAKEHWKIEPKYLSLTDYNICQGGENCGYLLIGDKVFDFENRFKYNYDLAQAWMEATNLPFVFAVWVARKGVEKQQIDQLEKALEFGVQNIEQSIEGSLYEDNKARNIDYLTNNISYIFDSEKRLALSKFLKKIPPSSF